jgi:hypothetical protein
MGNGEGIRSRLPKRLTISFWLWNYFYGSRKGDVFHDLERCFVELKERGFNSIRVDSGAGLLHTPQGAPRGVVMLRKPFKEFSTLRQMYFKNGGGRCDVMKHVLELFRLAKRYDVYVILSSWFYLHTFWYVDTHIREELFALPLEERFRFFAKECDTLVGTLKEEGLHTQIAFVEIFNEFSNFPTQWGLVKATSSDAEKHKVLHEFRRCHEEALAFLRDRHPDVLWAMDTASPNVAAEVLPRNAQLWNHHMYYAWVIYFKLLEDYVQGERFDFQHATDHPVIGRFLRSPTADIEAVKSSQDGDPRIDEGWYRRVWLYNSLRAEALPDLERLLSETLDRDMAEYKTYVEENIAAGLSIRNAHFPGMPLVMGEGATYCAHTAMRWEEKSDTYWSLIEYALGLLKKSGYWGCVPRTNCEPEDPSWVDCPDRLRHANELFLSP